MTKHATIDGPLGPFYIPAEPAGTARICTGLSLGVWGAAGGYDMPEAKTPEYYHSGLLGTEVRSVLDIGAGWGAFAVWARWLFGDDVNVIGYEPHDLGCKYVEINDPKSDIRHAAVTSSDTARLNVGEDWGASSTKFNGGDGDPVPVEHPQDLPSVDIMKIDAEGVEAEVLAGYPETHWNALKILVYEWHTPELRVECRAIVERRGGFDLLEDRDGPWGPGNGVAIWKRNGTI